MPSSKDYKLAIRIAGEIDKSLPNSMKLTKTELRALAKDAAIATDSGKWNKRFRDVSSGLEGVNRVGSKVFGAIKTGAETAAVAVGAIATASVTVGSSFEEQMSKVEAISGSSKGQMESLTDYARELGRDTAFSASEVGEAMEYMAMAGWKTEDMLDGVGSVLSLASAAGEDLGTTSDIVTDALTAFGYTAKDTERFADVLAQASSNANTNVSMMGETFKYVGATAGAFKYSAEDVAVSVGLMANAGIKASQSGTSLRKIMTNANGQIKLTGKAFAKAGEQTGSYIIKTTNADGSMKSWSTTVNNLRKAFSKMSESEKAQNAEAIAGKTAMAGLLAIVNASEKDYDKLTSSIKNSSGAAKGMADIRLDNLQGDIKLFRSALEDAGIEIYDELKYPLREVVQEGTEWVKEFTESFSYNFPTIMRHLEDAGEAIGNFAEPLLDVGGWLIENPDVFVGAIEGIGTAFATYKIASGISNLATSLSAIPGPAQAVIGIGAAVGVITAIGSAIEAANRRAKESSLEKHFGDVALSMEQLQDAADEIIGKKKLQEVNDLLSQMQVSENIYRDMEQLRKSIKRLDWKTSVGIELKKDEKSEYEKNVKKYVEEAQKVVDEKGYEIELATNVLFGDSEFGNQLNLDNSVFYTQLDKKVEKLSKKINSKLKKAMKDGMTVDLKEEINGLLDQLAEITTAINEAEVDAKWEVLQDSWSGKDLNPDSFRNLQKEIDENMKDVTSGVEKAYEESITDLMAKKKLGYIDEKEFQEKKGQIKSAKDKQIDDAYTKGLQFEWNTIMETYGDEIRSGNYSDGSQDAIREILDEISKQSEGHNVTLEQGQTIQEAVKILGAGIKNVRTAENPNAIMSWDMMMHEFAGVELETPEQRKSEINDVEHMMSRSYISSPDSENKSEKATGVPAERPITHGVPAESMPAPKELEKVLDGGKKAVEADVKEIQKTITSLPKDAQKDLKSSQIDFGDTIEKPLTKATNDASNSAKSSLQQQWKNVDISSNFNITGTFGVTKKGHDQVMSPLGGLAKGIKKHARGGIFRTPHIGMVAEGRDAEAIIPLNSSERSMALLEQTKQLMGIQDQPESLHNLTGRLYKMSAPKKSVTNNNTSSEKMSISFSPNITIQGSANKEEIGKAMELSFEKFEQYMKKYEKKKSRVSFAT